MIKKRGARSQVAGGRRQASRSRDRNTISGKPSLATLFRNISELYTFSGFVEKDGRRVSEKDLGRIQKGAILCEAGKIKWVGAEKQIPKSLIAKKIREVNLDQQIVMPALTECHTHLVFAGNRANEFEMRNRGATYQEIAAAGGGILSTMKATRAASAKDLQTLAQTRVNEFIRQGVTTIESKTGYALNLKDEIKCLEVMKKLTGARIVPTFLGAHACPPEFSSYEDYLEYLADQILPVVKKKNLAERVDVFVEKGFFAVASSKKYLQKAKDLGFEITIHADQLSLSGGSELGLDLDALSIDHVICMSDELVKKCARSKITSVLLPYADLFLKCPYPPARKLIEAGARVALATDFNPGSAPSQDVQLVGLLARLEMKMTLPEVLCAYTYGASAALGLQESAGALSENRNADFITLSCEMNEVFLSPGRSLVSQTYADAQLLNIK